MSPKTTGSRTTGYMAGGILVLCVSSASAAGPGGTATLTSDYVWRGSSQSQEEPAMQAGFHYQHTSGVYTSVWGSTVDFGAGSEATSEFDVAAGWAGPMGDRWAMDVAVVRYLYPGTGEELNWNELNLGLTLNDQYSLLIGYSDDALASDADGIYTELSATLPISETVYMAGQAGYYRLDGDYADSYKHGVVTLGWGFSDPFEVAVKLHGTDSAAKRLFPGMAGTRGEIALTASF